MEEVTIQIKRVRRSTTPIPLPDYMTEGAAGMDLCADVDHELRLPPLERALVPTGIAIALPHGFEAQIRPRSGLALTQGLTFVNSPGTIDSDYRGEIKLIAINMGQKPIVIKRGERVAQMVIQRVIKGRWREVDELVPSNREGRGFGHTGGGNPGETAKS